MILHIMKKDLRLLWPLVIILAILHAVEAVAVFRLGPFMEPRSLQVLVFLLPLVTILGMTVLAVLVVQQDPLPDGPQDWLVRPIRRGDLLLAKLLFVLLFVQGPAVLADALLGMATGFGPAAAMVAAAVRGIQLSCLFTLPALCVAAVTRSLVQALVVALGVLVVFLAGWSCLMILGVRPTLGGASLLWLLLALWQALAVLGALGVLRLQYFGRHTLPARWLATVVALLAFLSPLIFGWAPGFSFQSALAAERPASADPVSLVFDAAAPRFHPEGPRLAALAADNPDGNVGRSRVPAAIYLPLRVTGIPAEALVLSDRIEVRIFEDLPNGAELYRGPPNVSVDGIGSFNEARLAARASGDAAPIYQLLYLPVAVYRRIKDHPVRLELHWNLTLLRPAAPQSLPALDASQALPGFGRCASRIDDDGDGVLVGCQDLDGRPASCVRMYLEQPAAGLRNPPIMRCAPDYSPWPDHLWPTVLDNTGLELPFRDLNGLAKYPVNDVVLSSARIMLQFWQPRAHFERAITLRGLKLQDWEPQS